MLFSYNWLKDYIKGEIPKPKKLAEVLTMHSFEVEDVKKQDKDFILDIDILPDRAYDCFCHIGMAREIGAILNKEIVNYDNLEREKLDPEKTDLSKLKIVIKNSSLVPRYSALVIKDINIAQSPNWIKERLKAVGIKPINNIVDLTNFVMLETNQPLHAFDYDKIKKQKLILRKSNKGEKIITLDEVERKLYKGTLIAEDGKDRLVDLAGIMGGKLSQIDKNTNNIILQAANFDREIIYKASKKLKHKTEASNIYSQGITPDLTMLALERIFFLLKKEGGNPKLSQIIDRYKKRVSCQKIKLDLNYIEKLLGEKVSKKKIKKTFKSLEFKIVASTTKSITVEIPTFRQDILIPEDLIEEIGRIVGFEKIKPIFPVLSVKAPERNFNIFWRNRVKDILKEFGFTETYNYSFFGDKEADIFGYKKEDLIQVKNPVSLEQKYLRSSLIPNLMRNIEKNQKFKGISQKVYTKRIKLFELGKIFLKNNFSEKNMLSGTIADKEAKLSSEIFFNLKGTIDSLLNKLGITNILYDDFEPTPEESKKSVWNKERCAELKVGDEEIGFLGEINPSVCKKLKLSGKIVLFDIDFGKLKNLATEEQEYQPISVYPSAVRDLAVLVPIDIKVAEVLNLMNTAGGKLVRDIDLFDEYVGENLPRGRKNLAFHVIYQAEDRTLTSKEIDGIHKKIIRELEKNPQWKVRK